MFPQYKKNQSDIYIYIYQNKKYPDFLGALQFEHNIKVLNQKILV